MNNKQTSKLRHHLVGHVTLRFKVSTNRNGRQGNLWTNQSFVYALTVQNFVESPDSRVCGFYFREYTLYYESILTKS